MPHATAHWKFLALTLEKYVRWCTYTSNILTVLLRPGVPQLGRYGHILQPLDGDAKKLKPNCTVCRGCNVELTEIDKHEVSGWWQ